MAGRADSGLTKPAAGPKVYRGGERFLYDRFMNSAVIRSLLLPAVAESFPFPPRKRVGRRVESEPGTRQGWKDDPEKDCRAVNSGSDSLRREILCRAPLTEATGEAGNAPALAGGSEDVSADRKDSLFLSSRGAPAPSPAGARDGQSVRMGKHDALTGMGRIEGCPGVEPV